MSQHAARLNAEFFQESFSDQVRRLAVAYVGARLAEVHRQELRVHVGDVQQRDVAEGR
jgi:hypothetical protein